MKQQTAQIAILAQALVGAVLTIKRGDEEQTLKVGHDAVHHLQPGDEVTIKVASDERWLEHQRRVEEQASAQAQVRDDVDHSAKAGKGQTLAEGLAQAAEDGPADPGTPAGTTVQTGATRRTTTRGSSQA